jgi:hypothetical protein
MAVSSAVNGALAEKHAAVNVKIAFQVVQRFVSAPCWVSSVRAARRRQMLPGTSWTSSTPQTGFVQSAHAHQHAAGGYH